MIKTENTVQVKMPDGSFRTAELGPLPDDAWMAQALGYTQWPRLEGYEILVTGSDGDYSAKPTHYIEVFSDYHAPTLRYARVGKAWFAFPGVHDGWSQRRPWHPSPVVAANMARPENITTFSGCAWLAEETYGIPRHEVVVYTADDLEAKLALAAR